jgi:hypothetical protein
MMLSALSSALAFAYFFTFTAHHNFFAFPHSVRKEGCQGVGGKIFQKDMHGIARQRCTHRHPGTGVPGDGCRGVWFRIVF